MIHKRVTLKKYEFLELIISNSKDVATDEARRVILWILRQSQRLSKPVCVSIPYDEASHKDSLALQVSKGICDMNNYDRNTFLPNHFFGIGSRFVLSSCHGRYDNGRYISGEGVHFYTIWLGVGACCDCSEFKELNFPKDQCSSEKIRNYYSRKSGESGINAFAEFRGGKTFANQ
jgi:hypothetical protein